MIPICSSYGPILGPQYIPLYNMAGLYAIQTSLETL